MHAFERNVKEAVYCGIAVYCGMVQISNIVIHGKDGPIFHYTITRMLVTSLIFSALMLVLGIVYPRRNGWIALSVSGAIIPLWLGIFYSPRALIFLLPLIGVTVVLSSYLGGIIRQRFFKPDFWSGSH